MLVLMKLRLGLLNSDLAFRFGISDTLVSSIFTSWIKFLSCVLSFLIYWPDKECTRANLPTDFRKRYPNLRATVDCTEFFIERPSDLEVQNVTWSDYKHHNTVKSLISITPRGSISFVSDAWGGRASDRQITIESGILNNVDRKDQWLADRGFLIKSELLERGRNCASPLRKR